MTVDHEQLVLDAAAAILRSRGESALAAGVERIADPGERMRDPPEGATILQQRLHEAIKKTGRSPRSISLEAGSAEMVRAILNGRSESPRAVNLFRLADILEVDARWLLGMEKRP